MGVHPKAKNKSLLQLRLDKGWSQEVAAKELEIPIISYQKMEQGKMQGKPAAWLRVQHVYKIADKDMWKIVKQSI